jgi:hypothetical protein
VLAGIVAVVLLAAGERSLNALRAGGEPAWGACWIWAEVALDDPRPLAFLAVREFELTSVPGEAWVSALADESFVLFLNGSYVGAGTYSAEARMARYRVESLLHVGTNRLVVELRSRRGVGGFLANLLVDGEGALGRPVVVTDGDWQIFRRDERSTWRAGSLPKGEPARVWHQAPTGRWRPRTGTEPLPIPLQGNTRPRRITALRKVDSDRTLQLFEWEEEVEGFLLLNLPSQETPPALAWFGDEKPDPRSRAADELLIFLPGQHLWRDRHPRRFKYLLLAGLKLSKKPQVRLLKPEVSLRLRPPLPLKGVLGITPPFAHSAAEVAIWQRLQR